MAFEGNFCRPDFAARKLGTLCSPAQVEEFFQCAVNIVFGDCRCAVRIFKYVHWCVELSVMCAVGLVVPKKCAEFFSIV